MNGSISLHIKGRIHIVNILLVQFFPQKLHSFAKTLEMDDFSLPEEFDHIIYIRIIAEPENIVVGDPCLLLWYAQSFATIFILKFWNKRLISAILSLKYSYIFGFLLNWPV